MSSFNHNKKISVAMISNAMSHHQLPFCNAMNASDKINFTFIATKPLRQERINMGYRDLNKEAPYIIRSYESEKAYSEAKRAADESDFVIYGSAPFDFIKDRIKNGKWTFLYSERIFKEKRGGDFLNLKTIAAYALRYSFSSKKTLRLLCSSAYTSQDYKTFGFHPKNAYKWGYFPPQSMLSYEQIKAEKTEASIVWVGRMIHWKHPEMAIMLADKLKKNNINFKLTMVGTGVMLDSLQNMTKDLDICDCVSFVGPKQTDETRKIMEQSQILIATSDYNEGWGAVINEGMSSGCAVAASHSMGAAPYLIKDGKNGVLFESENIDDLYEKTAGLLNNPALCQKMGKNAYHTITDEWNGEAAAQRLIALMENYWKDNTNFAFEKGICSVAEPMKTNWYKVKR